MRGMSVKKYRIKLSPDERKALEEVRDKGSHKASKFKRSLVFLLADESEEGPDSTPCKNRQRRQTGFEEDLSVVRLSLKELENLRSIGRQGVFAYPKHAWSDADGAGCDRRADGGNRIFLKCLDAKDNRAGIDTIEIFNFQQGFTEKSKFTTVESKDHVLELCIGVIWANW